MAVGGSEHIKSKQEAREARWGHAKAKRDYYMGPGGRINAASMEGAEAISGSVTRGPGTACAAMGVWVQEGVVAWANKGEGDASGVSVKCRTTLRVGLKCKRRSGKKSAPERQQTRP